jgi:hypothetical protein
MDITIAGVCLTAQVPSFHAMEAIASMAACGKPSGNKTPQGSFCSLIQTLQSTPN